MSRRRQDLIGSGLRLPDPRKPPREAIEKRRRAMRTLGSAASTFTPFPHGGSRAIGLPPAIRRKAAASNRVTLPVRVIAPIVKRFARSAELKSEFASGQTSPVLYQQGNSPPATLFARRVAADRNRRLAKAVLRRVLRCAEESDFACERLARRRSIQSMKYCASLAAIAEVGRRPLHKPDWCERTAGCEPGLRGR